MGPMLTPIAEENKAVMLPHTLYRQVFQLSGRIGEQTKRLCADQIADQVYLQVVRRIKANAER